MSLQTLRLSFLLSPAILIACVCASIVLEWPVLLFKPHASFFSALKASTERSSGLESLPQCFHAASDPAKMVSMAVAAVLISAMFSTGLILPSAYIAYLFLRVPSSYFGTHLTH